MTPRTPRRPGLLRRYRSWVLLFIGVAVLVCVLWMAGVAAFRLSTGK